MRSPAWPSQSGGRRGPGGPAASTSATAAGTSAGCTRRFVPWVIVTGRSVLGRTVRQGTPKMVVSSWTPPESVMTTVLSATRDRNGR